MVSSASERLPVKPGPALDAGWSDWTLPPRRSERQINDNINDLKNLGIRRFYWQSLVMNRKCMNQKPSGVAPPQADPDRVAPTTRMISLALIGLANLRRRGVLLRYKRLAGCLP
jgi:hypothetical protein